MVSCSFSASSDMVAVFGLWFDLGWVIQKVGSWTAPAACWPCFVASLPAKNGNKSMQQHNLDWHGGACMGWRLGALPARTIQFNSNFYFRRNWTRQANAQASGDSCLDYHALPFLKKELYLLLWSVRLVLLLGCAKLSAGCTSHTTTYIQNEKDGHRNNYFPSRCNVLGAARLSFRRHSQHHLLPLQSAHFGPMVPQLGP